MHLQANGLWMRSFTNMSCQSIALETIFSSRKTMPHTCNMTRNCLQAGHTYLLTGLLCPDPSPNRPALGYSTLAGTWLVCLPSCLITGIRNPAGWTLAMSGVYKCIPRLLLSMHKRLKGCINKGWGDTRYELWYTVELRWLELVGTIGASSTHPCVRAIPSLTILKLVHVFFMSSRTPRFYRH